MDYRRRYDGRICVNDRTYNSISTAVQDSFQVPAERDPAVFRRSIHRERLYLHDMRLPSTDSASVIHKRILQDSEHFCLLEQYPAKDNSKEGFRRIFPFLFTFILSSVQLVNIATGYSIYAFDWEAMHRLTIGAFICIFALVYFCMRRNFRQGPYIPFKGIDYLGVILWSLWLLCIIFIFVYGEHYEWLEGEEIRTALVFSAVLLVLAIHRAATIRHPYISLKTFSQKNMLFIFILFGCMTLMSATSTSIQNIFTGSILGFDARHNADLNWGIVAGICAGTGFSYLATVKCGWRMKDIVFAGFVSFFLYQCMLYFLIDTSTEKYMLYLPLFFKGAGVSIIYTSLTYALAGCVTFSYYFEAMCVIGFIRTSFGGPMSSAIVTHFFKHATIENTSGLGSYVDSMYLDLQPLASVSGEFQRQMMMVSIKEVYGYAVIAAITILIAIMMSDYRHLAGTDSGQMLKLIQIWKSIRHKSIGKSDNNP